MLFVFKFSSHDVNLLFDSCRYADEPSIMRYIKIAATLRDKTVRDVALRCRWMMVRTFFISNVLSIP